MGIYGNLMESVDKFIPSNIEMEFRPTEIENTSKNTKLNATISLRGMKPELSDLATMEESVDEIELLDESTKISKKCGKSIYYTNLKFLGHYIIIGGYEQNNEAMIQRDLNTIDKDFKAIKRDCKWYLLTAFKMIFNHCDQYGMDNVYTPAQLMNISPLDDIMYYYSADIATGHFVFFYNINHNNPDYFQNLMVRIQINVKLGIADTVSYGLYGAPKK